MRISLVILLAWLSAFAHAETSPDSAALELRLEKLERDLAELKTAPSESLFLDGSAIDAAGSKTFLGPVASKIYLQPEAQWQFGLSTEFFSYAQQTGISGGPSRTNVTSLAPTLAFRLHPRLIFNSQILLENGGAESSGSVTVQKGQAIVQMAYLDWMFADNQEAGFRIGHQLIPVGQMNTLNDPTTYFGVQKPELERELIPSSWHENGVSVWVDRPRATLEAGVFSSLNAQGFRKETFLAGGRSQGQESPTSNVMGVFRLHGKMEHAIIGGSLAFGNSDQNAQGLRTGAFQLSEVHGRLFWKRIEVYAITATAQVQDAGSISILNSTVMPEQVSGSSLQIAGELLGRDHKLWLFTRYSHYNLQDRVPDGLTADLRLDKSVWTSGISYFPLSTLVLKADYGQVKTAAGTNDNGFNVGLGLIY